MLRLFEDHFERDDWDAFVFSYSPEQVGFGNYDVQKYPFVVRKGDYVAEELVLPWDTSLSFDERIHIWKRPFYQVLGYGFWWEREGQYNDEPLRGWKRNVLEKTFFPASPAEAVISSAGEL